MNKLIAIICAVGSFLPAGAQHVAWALKAEYDTVSHFSEGIAAARKNGKWGYVSDRGTEILAPAYDMAFPFSEGAGVLASKDNTLNAIVDSTGKLTPVIDKLQIDSRFAVFSDGLLLVRKNNKWGYIKKDGTTAIACRWDIAYPFSEGLAAAVLDYKPGSYFWCFMDMNGVSVIQFPLRTEVWSAFGFYEGKALVLHSKGAYWLDKSGKELKESLPRITAPRENSEYGKETLVCREGILAFDTKRRAVSFTTQNGGITEFIPTSVPEHVTVPDYAVLFNGASSAGNELIWLNPTNAVIKTADSKYGMLTVYDRPVLDFSFSADTLYSVFGNPVVMNLNIRNTSPKKLDGIDITVNEKTFHASSLQTGSTASFPFSLDKMTENEAETTDITVVAWEAGLHAGESKKTVWIKNKPSLSINVPTTKITLRFGQESYSLKIEVKNLSETPANNLTVTVDSQNQTIERLAGGETGSVQFSFPRPKETAVRALVISVKAPKTPPVAEKVSITIEVPPPPTPPPF